MTAAPISTQPVVTQDIAIDGPYGAVPVRLYRPTTPGQDALVWMHGGAFRYGSIDDPEGDATARYLAARGITVVSVDYRLASDNVAYPMLTDEVMASWQWATTNELRLRWHLGGASAGANLAVSAALQLCNRGSVQPTSLILAYPTLHPTLPPAPSELRKALQSVPAHRRFTAAAVEEFNNFYVRDPAARSHGYAFPPLADLRGLPPVLIVNSQFDDLRASGQAFGVALIDAGVDTTVINEKGAYHGHLSEPNTPAAAVTLNRFVTWLAGAVPAAPVTADTHLARTSTRQEQTP